MSNVHLRLVPRHLSDQHFLYLFHLSVEWAFTLFACCLLDIMYLVLLLFNDNLLILKHSLILDSSLLISDVMFLLVSSLNESIVLESVVSLAYIMK